MNEAMIGGAAATTKETTFDYIKTRQNQIVERLEGCLKQTSHVADALLGSIPHAENEAAVRERSEGGHLGDVREGVDRILDALTRLEHAIGRLDVV